MKTRNALLVLALLALPLSAQAGVVDGKIAKLAEPLAPAQGPCANHHTTYCAAEHAGATQDAGLDARESASQEQQGHS